jgi:hypothetical protein
LRVAVGERMRFAIITSDQVIDEQSIVMMI